TFPQVRHSGAKWRSSSSGPTPPGCDGGARPCTCANMTENRTSRSRWRRSDGLAWREVEQERIERTEGAATPASTYPRSMPMTTASTTAIERLTANLGAVLPDRPQVVRAAIAVFLAQGHVLIED